MVAARPQYRFALLVQVHSHTWISQGIAGHQGGCGETGDGVEAELGQARQIGGQQDPDVVHLIGAEGPDALYVWAWRGQEGTREVLLVGVHAGLPKYYVEERKMLLASKDVDEYLRKRRERMVKLLEGHMKDGTPFYNQMIDQDALDFVRANPEVAGGVRRGKKIYQTKIPYMMIEYLKEKDPKLKRYYGCHCLLARESILSGKEMSRNLCYCSAGYEKMPYEVAFGKPVKTVVLKSILWGDDICRFSMEIPEKYLPKKE